MSAENFPPGIGKEPVCPSYQLIEVCAQLAGIEMTKENFFCGTMPKRVDDVGILSGFKGTVYESRSECSEVYIKLASDLNEAKQKIEVPDENRLRRKLGGWSLELKRDMLNKWYDLKTRKDKQDKIIRRWRQIIWKEYVGPTPEGRNRMFRGFREPEELTDKYVIDYVKNEFLLNLGKIVNRNGYYFSDIGGKEIQAGTQAMYKERCPQAPKRREEGKHYLTL